VVSLVELYESPEDMQRPELEPNPAPFSSLQALFGSTPNLFRAQCLLPRVVDAEVEIASAVLLEEHLLSKNQKFFLLLAVAAAHRNTYWVTIYDRSLQSFGVPKQQLDQFLVDFRRVGLSTHETTLIEFAIKLATNASHISARDIARLRDHEFIDEAILEAILVAALSNFFCVLASGLRPAPDFDRHSVFIGNNFRQPTDDNHLGGFSGPYLRTLEISLDHFPPFGFFKKRFGWVPNIFRAQTLRPDVIKAEATLVRNFLAPDDLLSHFQKECIMLVSSAANLNTYCVAAHCEMLRALGVSSEESDQIAVDHHQANLSEADKSLLDFVLQLTMGSSELQADYVENLQGQGFSGKQIVEAIAVTAVNGFFNTLQMGLGSAPDVEPRRVFEPEKMHPQGRDERPTDVIQIDPDAGLVTRVKNGDLQAFEELVSRHSRRVYRTLVAIAGSAEEAQDAVQDTFLKAFEHIGDFQNRSKFSTWLTSIASNTALQRLREQKRFESLNDGEESEFRPRQVPAWEADPEQSYSQAERRALVERALMKVPSKYRVVLVLRDLEQLSTEEAAAALGLHVSALKARLFRARLMLREALSPHFSMNGKGAAS
jgi:RNA polymerase sigma-70 factor (ECF subfamily)